jgi:hypothetical protein
MAKKAVTAVPRKPAADSNQPLLDAIVAVKHLQEFIRAHGTLEKALEAVARVNRLVDLTGSFELLRKALEIIGKEEAPPQG